MQSEEILLHADFAAITSNEENYTVSKTMNEKSLKSEPSPSLYKKTSTPLTLSSTDLQGGELN
jgi:hypothetical protein